MKITCRVQYLWVNIIIVEKNKNTVVNCDLVVSVQMSEKTLNIETATEKEIASIQSISVKKDQ